MSINKIDSYLRKIEENILTLPIEIRSQEILEFKNKIEEIRRNNISISDNQIMFQLGDPDEIAQKIKRKFNLVDAKKSRGFLRKFFVFSSLVMAIFIALITITIWWFSPLVEFDEAQGKLKFLGGAINIDFVNYSMTSFGKKIGGPSSTIDGATNGVNEVEINFNKGDFSLGPTNEDKLVWDCSFNEIGNKKNWGNKIAKRFIFDFTSTSFSKCLIKIPRASQVFVKGEGGKILLIEMDFNTEVNLESGIVKIRPKSTTNYVFNLEVLDGNVDLFESKGIPENSFKQNIKVGSGKILRDGP